MASFTGEKFFKALTSGSGLSLAAKPTVTGMVKQYDERTTAIIPLPEPPFVLFSPTMSCAVWLPVPISLIDSVDYLGTGKCKDHEHEVVRIHFKIPSEPDAALFAHLLHQSQQVKSFGNGSEFPSEFFSPSVAAFGFPHIPTPHFPPIHIPTPHWPPIHIPDPRDALRKEAERLARATAATIDHQKGSSTYCPREEIRAGILALGATLYLTPDPTGGSKFMAGVMGVIAVTLPDEYCRESGR